MAGEREKEKELVELFEAAKKAAEVAQSQLDGGADESRCLDALYQLKAFPVTLDSLVNTKVGKLLRPLTKHAMKNIQVLASEIFAAWKQMVLMQTAELKNGTVENKISPETKQHLISHTSKPLKSQNMTTAEVKDLSVSDNVKVEKNRQGGAPPHTMKMLPKSNDYLRDKMQEQIYESLCRVSSEVNDDRLSQVNASDPVKVALSVESAMFEKWGRSNDSHKIKYRSVLFNIKDPKNPDFRRKVLLGHIKPEEIVNLSSEEMASDARQHQNEKIKQKALFHCELGCERAASTDQFKCKRCGQRKTTYYQMQTRSADEPMTTYVTCVNCNFRWKFC